MNNKIKKIISIVIIVVLTMQILSPVLVFAEQNMAESKYSNIKENFNSGAELVQNESFDAAENKVVSEKSKLSEETSNTDVESSIDTISPSKVPSETERSELPVDVLSETATNGATFDGISLSGADDQVSYNNYQSSIQAKTLEINASFDTSTSVTNRKVKVKLKQGLGFSTLPGMIATSIDKNNWEFDATTLPVQLQGVILNATYVPDTIIQGYYQPKSGTVIYEFSSGTSLVNLNFSLVSDRSLNISNSDITLNNAIQVTAFEDERTIYNEQLESYTLTGFVFPINFNDGKTQSLVLQPGDTGSIFKRVAEYNDQVNLLTSSLLVTERIVYTYKVDKNAGLTAVNLSSNWSNQGTISVVFDRTSDSTYDYAVVTLEQLRTGNNTNLEFVYTIPDDAQKGSYQLVLESAEITANGQTFSDTRQSSEKQTIQISTEPKVVLKNPDKQYLAYSSENSVVGMESLGGFMISNAGATSGNKKMQLRFDDTNIGVRGASIAFEENGMAKNIVVKTSKGQTFTIDQVSGTNMVEKYGFSRYTFLLTSLGIVANDEYITEISYEMGKIKANASSQGAFNTVENMLDTSHYAIPIAYHGKVLNISPSKSYSATAVLVDEDKDFDDASALTATNNIQIVGAADTTFSGSINLSDSTQVLSGTIKNLVVSFDKVDYPYTVNVPSLVKGYDVYIREGEHLNVLTETITATYEGVTYSIADGTLALFPITDNTGNRVYKIEFPDVILGKAKEDSFKAYTPLKIAYDVKVKGSAPTTYIPANELVQIHAKDFKTTTSIGGSTKYSNNPDTFDVNNNGDTDEYVGTPNNSLGIQIIAQKDFKVTTAANINDNPWTSYDYNTNTDIIDLNPNGNAKYRLTVMNNTDNSVNGYTALIPVPKAGEKTDLTPTSPSEFDASIHLQKETFTWTTSIAEKLEISGTLDYQVLYATSYETNKDSTKFKSWNEINDKDEIRMIKVTTTSTIPAGFSEAIDFPIELNDPDADLHAGNTNIYSARIYREILGTAGYKPSEPVAIRLQTGVVKGQVFEDTNRNGLKDSDETGINGVVVLAYKAGSNRAKLIETTTTKTIVGKDGCYEFMGLDKNQDVDIVFINPSTDDSLRFSKVTENGSTPTADSDYLKAETSGITPSDAKYDRIDAGLIPPVKINFDAGKGSMAQDIIKKYPGEVITSEPDVEWTGTVFKGWYNASTGGNRISFPYTVGTKDITFYARYTPNTYTVTYNVEGTTSTAPTLFDSLLTKPTDPEKAGYNFSGWYTEANGGEKWDFTDDKMPASNLTLYARFGVKSYTLTFDNDGTITTQEVEYNTLASEPKQPTKTGYTFEGWYTEATGGSKWDFTTNKMPGNNFTLYAHYQVNSYTASFEVEGTVVSTETVNFGTVLIAPTAPTKEGYTFNGWYDEKEIKWSFTTSKMPAKDILLTARFTADDQLISFDVAGGDEASKPANIEAPIDSAIDIDKVKKPTKLGYAFVGWFDESGTQVSGTITMPLGGLTLFAHWIETEQVIHFNSNGGKGVPSFVALTNDTFDIDTQVTTRAGYTFLGWYNEDDQLVSGVQTVPAGGATYIAKWQAENQNITFDVNGGDEASKPAEITSPTGSKIDIDAVDKPTKSGYNFIGWYTPAGKVAGIITMPAGGLNLVAHWEVKKDGSTTTLDQENNQGKNNGIGTDNKAVNQKKATELSFPKTGEKHSLWLVVFGIFFVVVFGVVVIQRKRKN